MSRYPFVFGSRFEEILLAQKREAPAQPKKNAMMYSRRKPDCIQVDELQ
jgi:hypothetical protein